MMRLTLLLLSGVAFASAAITADKIPFPAQDELGGNLWAVLTAGSDGWINYRHQADICHAYQLLIAHGVPEERIIVFMRDDIAHNLFNKDRGVIKNRRGGPNVYTGVPKDYTKSNYTLNNWFSVLAGNQTSTGGKTLKSGPNDNVFIVYADHGAPGISMLGSDIITATAVNQAIENMHKSQMFKNMLIYWESCESGSMFHNILPSNLNVFVATASSPYESSYACYYDFFLDTYLGDCFSVHWMEDSDRLGDLSTETVDEQVKIVKNETLQSHEHTYGDKSLVNLTLDKFQGSKPATPIITQALPSDAVRQEDVPILTLRAMVEASNDAKEALEHLELANKLQQDRSVMLDTTMNILKSFPEEWITTTEERTNSLTRDQLEHCYYPLVDAFNSKCYQIGCNNFALRMVRYFTDLCVNGVSVEKVTHQMDMVCDQHIQKTKCGIE